jgi:polysaccharide deacetylase family protein (PEP-CTERM system associated)
MNYFLSVDLEDWYHLEYFKKYNFKKKDIFVSEMIYFLDLLDIKKIKITFFILGELIAEHHELITEISHRGHEIAIHGWDHELLHNKSDKLFSMQIHKAKNELEKLHTKPVIGYRAPCFSMNNKKFELLKNLGIKYDSSYIKFSSHPLYGNLDVSNFNKIEDHIYEKNGVYEFELPTLKLFNKSIPISGGGYFRMNNLNISKLLIKNHYKKNKNFTFYTHPFELSHKTIDLRFISMIDKFRFSIGRKNNIIKTSKYIDYLIQFGCEFRTIESYVNKL